MDLTVEMDQHALHLVEATPWIEAMGRMLVQMFAVATERLEDTLMTSLGLQEEAIEEAVALVASALEHEIRMGLTSSVAKHEEE